MREALPDVLHSIGSTPLIGLRNVVPGNGSRILLKMESRNPTGSMKDRMALAMINAAEADGRLRPGGSVVEYTAGSTGLSLAMVCAVKGHPLEIVSSDAFARQKLDRMRQLGARLHIVRSDRGRMTEKLTRDMIEMARGLADRTGAFWTNQLDNPDQIAGYRAMGEEIWTQTGGRIDAFVQGVGSAGAISGVAAALREHADRIEIVAVEPTESPVLSGGRTGSHRIDGIGAGFVVPLWRDEIADRLDRVSTDEATAMARRLARQEGLLAGLSTGANVVAALRWAEECSHPATVVTVLCDAGAVALEREPTPEMTTRDQTSRNGVGMTAMTIPFGGKLARTETGTGSSVVLVHGSPGQGRSWGRVARFLSGFRLVMPDLPGYGNSNPLPPGSMERSAAIGSAIAELIEASDNPVLLVGHSYGGNVALHAALEAPHNVRGLLLLEPVFFRALALTGSTAALEPAARFFDAYIARVEAGEETAVSMMIDYWFGEGAFQTLPDPVREFLQDAAPKNAVDVRASFSEVLTREAFTAFRAPTAIVHGGASPDITRSIATALSALLHESEVKELPGGTHGMLDANPAEVADLVRALDRRAG